MYDIVMVEYKTTWWPCKYFHLLFSLTAVTNGSLETGIWNFVWTKVTNIL